MGKYHMHSCALEWTGFQMCQLSQTTIEVDQLSSLSEICCLATGDYPWWWLCDTELMWNSFFGRHGYTTPTYLCHRYIVHRSWFGYPYLWLNLPKTCMLDVQSAHFKLPAAAGTVVEYVPQHLHRTVLNIPVVISWNTTSLNSFLEKFLSHTIFYKQVYKANIRHLIRHLSNFWEWSVTYELLLINKLV